ncbi:response regulator transcription factor [Lentilactobacillus hilgardii]|uniref:Response regulator n=1 Tax=Lentilactobacillus hilgardii TaxID=1588 RepID=A0A6P1E9Q8_LENHI|nr:response regulator transcription factor [Lentilactobacillus hilgardii]EEI70378.1 response regulator receiver domain protein [Lentilactobacillus hilgardii ATCC 27305]MCT3392861.1 DNA-binding response regulator [Lentilactobacillus hilgardii]QHB52355.1 response regulator [Lentilactobacillus hilgardii]RRG09435.1 MAG: DNA-binding response regulator [Lactobacillus sp.]
MKKVLVVDDEPAIVTLLEYNLKQASFDVQSATNGADALSMIENNHYDIVLLDLMLPEMSGEEVLKRIRMDRNDTPVIVLTAKDTEFDKVFGLEMGADDYVPKPFSPREVIARINAVLRRYEKSEPSSQQNAAPVKSGDIETTGPFTIDHKQYKVSVNDQNLKLTPKEFELMQYLVGHENQVLSRDQLLQGVWGFDYSGQSRMVDIQIAHLREKIESDPKRPKYLKTIRGFGYEFSTGGDDAE